MHGAALEKRAKLGELHAQINTPKLKREGNTHTMPQRITCGMLLNMSAANEEAAASVAPAFFPETGSDFEGGASRESAAALAAALDSASAAFTRAWLRLKGEEKSPAER